MERADANRQRALLQQEIKNYPDKLNALASHLNRTDDDRRVVDAVSVLAGLIGAGGLERLNQLVMEYKNLTDRASDLSRTLRNAGAE